MNKAAICLWYDRDAEEAARFYARTFPDSEVGAVSRAPSDYPGGKKGDPLVVNFTILGVPCIGLNGGPSFPHSEAFSFQVMTGNQEERIATGAPSSETGARKAPAAGARTGGASRGRSRPASSPRRSPPAARRRAAPSRR